VANRFRETPIAQTKPEPAEKQAPVRATSKPRRKGVVAKSLSSVFSGTFLASEKNLTWIPFLLFLSVLSIFYIGYNYYADDNIRRENRLNREIKEFHSEYISTTSELMFATKQSELAVAAAKIGLKEPLVPPFKIETDSTALYPAKPADTE
jgi:hypothetical protein